MCDENVVLKGTLLLDEPPPATDEFAWLDPGVKREWVAALRSGEYQQGKNFLRVGDKLCCLGVRCELAASAGVIPEGILAHYLYDGNAGLAPEAEILHAYGLGEDADVSDAAYTDSYLAQLNDDGLSFAEIADWIEEHL